MLIGCSGSAITSWQIIVHAKVGSKPSSQFQPLSRVKGIGDEEIDFYLLTHIFMPLMIAVFFLRRLSFSTEIHFLCFYHEHISALLCFGNLCLKWFVPCWGSKRFWEKFPHSSILISNNTFSSILLLSLRQLEEVQSSWTKWSAENVSAAHLPLITPFHDHSHCFPCCLEASQALAELV